MGPDEDTVELFEVTIRVWSRTPYRRGEGMQPVPSLPQVGSSAFHKIRLSESSSHYGWASRLLE